MFLLSELSGEGTANGNDSMKTDHSNRILSSISRSRQKLDGYRVVLANSLCTVSMR